MKFAKFITECYKRYSENVSLLENELIRSERQLLRDLITWGFTYKEHKKNVYIAGHERVDVVLDRNKFVKHFIDRKNHYYRVTEEEIPEWIKPTEKPCVILFHDETTYNSTDTCSKKWTHHDHTSFYNKSRGRNLMFSGFIVAHEHFSYFNLSDEEFKKAAKKYPSLLEPQLRYDKNSCDDSMNPGASQDGYFDNDCVLDQFERLFQMLEFKTAFNFPVKNDIEIVVDNARTHTAQTVNLNEFCLKPGGKCAYKTLKWKDESNNDVELECFDADGISKGLKQIAIELGYEPKEKIKLAEIKELLKDHLAFAAESKLEVLARNYGVKIIFNPKFHCELNPIEGRWCSDKAYIRPRTDQTYNRMIILIEEAKKHYEEKKLNIKLIRRWWRTLHAYSVGVSFQDILLTYFSGKTKSKVQEHLKIYNTYI